MGLDAKRACHGWAYQGCSQPAVFAVHEEQIAGLSWSEYNVCLIHAMRILQGWQSESSPNWKALWLLTDQDLPEFAF